MVIAEESVITTNELPLELWETSSNRLAPNGNDLLDAWTPTNGDGTKFPELAGSVKAERVDHERREREHLVRALAATGGNKAEAARALGMAQHAGKPAETAGVELIRSNR